MKKLVIYLIVLAGCNAASTHSDIQGIYTCSYQNEFYKTDDTLILKNIKNTFYQIERRTRNNLKMKHEKWTLQYDPCKKIFTEMKKGKIIFWEGNSLILGDRIYQKSK